MDRIAASVASSRPSTLDVPRLLVAVAPVAVVSVGAVVQLTHTSGAAQSPLWLAAVLSALLAVPLFWRNTRPLACFAVIATVAFVQWACDIRLVADIALLFAIYSVATRLPLRTSLVAAGVVEVGAILAVVRWNPADARLESFVLLSGPLAAALFAGIAVRNQRRALSAAVERGELLARERDQAAAIEVAIERARIAREMHDVVAHGLSIMVTMADAAVAKQTADPAVANAAMRQVSATGREAMGDMRRLLGVLHTGEDADHRPQPGLDDLGPLVDHTRQTGMNVELECRGDVPHVSNTLQLTMYRVVQEALTNVVKHAVRPSKATVVITYDPSEVMVEVSDDGEPDGHRRATGFGLVGMRERVDTHGGSVSAGPQTDRGWRVTATIPITGDDR